MNVQLLLFAALLFLGPIGQAQEVSTILTKPSARFEGVTWGGNGRIYVVDFVSGEVFKIDVEGNRKRVGPLFSGALGGAMDKEHNFYFSEYGTGKIIKIKPDDTHEEYCSGLNGPTGILIDDDNQLMYISNYGSDKISKVDMSVANPTPQTFAISGLFAGPDGLCFSPEGDLISANFDDNRIQKITPEGQVMEFTRVSGSPNTGYITRIGDTYYSAGGNGHDIYTISLDGVVSKFSGAGQAGYEDGAIASAKFTFPNGITANPTGDTLIITESSTAGRIRMITNLQGTTSISTPAPPKIHISPNPVSEFLHIEFTLSEKKQIAIHLLDLKGSTVDTILAPEKQQGLVDLSYQRNASLPKGIYIVDIEIAGEHVTRRVVLE